MVWCRIRTHCLGARSLLALGLLGLAGTFAAGYATAGSGQPTPAEPEARLRELMTQRYEILKVMVQNSEQSLQAGRADLMTHLNLTAALYRAEADLCTNTANRVKVYEMLVEALAPLEKLLERQGAAGRVPQGEVDQGKLVRLDAQIDLERLRLGQSASQPWLRERYERRQ